ncbi:FCD domain-containing protein [uncultured Desulfovibrio sp.]|uniref:FadR/GntR family transcriptional regulator n=1 Tax=uncultured Desulfovibrio sp. TaxID=167968 RepID=UPI00260F8D52|nr:FCD domain-containing protein [uncultured Desulfovibrio sp.]
MDAFSAKSPQRSYETLLSRLRAFMDELQLKPGDKLPPERSLASTFGVSRNSVRTAIRTLADQGVLESRHGDGTYVCSSETDFLEKALLSAVDSECAIFDEVMEFRRIMEPAIARLAARRRTLEQLNELKIIVCDQQRRLLMEKGDGDLDARFHQCLARCTGNSLLATTMQRLNTVYQPGRTADLRSEEWRQFSISSHLRIIDAVERQDEEACEQELRHHLGTVSERHPLVTARDRS